MGTWIGLRLNAPEAIGFIPSFLNEDDPRPAREQLDSNYQHGGGWRPFEGFKLNQQTMELSYPGDPPYKAVAFTNFHEKEVVIIYPHGWVLILQGDGSYEVARMD